MIEFIASKFNYWTVVVLMMVGLYIVFATGNMVKRLVGLGVFQTSVFLLYISLSKVSGGIPPILPLKIAQGAAYADKAGEAHGGETAGHAGGAAEVAGNAGAGAQDLALRGLQDVPRPPPVYTYHADALDQVYSNPLPHVLILTAIVVGVSTLAVGLALVVRIREAYGTIEDEDINAAEFDTAYEGANR